MFCMKLMVQTSINCKVIENSCIAPRNCQQKIRFEILRKKFCFIENILLILHYNFEAIHNKDYSVVKTFKEGE